MNGDANDEGGTGKKKAGVLQLFKAVAWAFLGIRKRSGLEADVAHLNPVALIVVGLVCAAIFVAVLLVIVHFVAG